MMNSWKKALVILVFCIIFIGTIARIGFTQPPWGLLYGNPLGFPFYSPYALFGGNYLFASAILPPLYGTSAGWGNPFWPVTIPTPTLLPPYQRSPNATIIFTSPTLTSVSTAPGVILVGATTAIGAPSVIVPDAPIITEPAPAPLFSLLAVIYASSILDGHALLSTANPLLFAYISTLVL